MMNQSRGATTSDLCTTSPILSHTGVQVSDKIIFKDGTGKDDGKTSPTHNQSYSVRTDVGASNETNVSQSDSESNQTTVSY